MPTEIASLIIEADSSQVLTADKRLQNLNKTGKSTQTQLKNTRTGFQGAGRQAGQASIQMQQFVGQVQAGTPFLTAFSMQASDLGIVLGAPLAGAVAGISSALVSMLIPAMTGGADSAEELREKIEELAEEYGVLSQAMINVLEIQYTEELKDQQDQYAKLEAQLNGYTASLQRQQNQIDSNAASGRRVTEGEIKRLQETDNHVQALISQMEILDKETKETEQTLANLGRGFLGEDQLAALEIDVKDRRVDSGVTAIVKQGAEARSELESVMAQLRTKEEALEFAHFERVAAIREAHNQGVIATQEEKNALILKSEEKLFSSLKDLNDRDKSRQEAENAARIQTMTSLFDGLTVLMASESREAFRVGQAASIASATIKGVESTINAYEFGTDIGGPVVGAVFAGIAAATTGAMIGQIASASPPRAQGGQMLPNKSYIAGEFGPEVIHTGASGGFVTQMPESSAPVNIQVANNNYAPGVESKANVRQVGDRDFIVEVMTSELGNQQSRATKALRTSHRLNTRGSYG